MVDTYSITVQDNQVKIYINGLVHLVFRQDKFVGFEAWIVGDTCLKHRLEIYLEGDGKIFAEYETRERWAEVLKLLDRNDLCVGFEE